MLVPIASPTSCGSGVESGGMWVFGYGSLIWRPTFPFAERVGATVRGWERRFWQGSVDHRGVVDAPGRVVTLVQAPDVELWGMAYRIEEARREEVLAHLDVREQGGYVRLEIDARLEDGRAVRALVYFAGPDNPQYLGPAPLEAIVQTVRSARGPSGDNAEYALRLAEAIRDAGREDAHVFAVARALSEGIAPR